ncbi:dienelactone hydrolase family protein [Nocardioides sp. J2M5]|uniref:dienelactone hydrolase family protein n=1 Tax=Nocardioides palaemonis TaxID=2829810 RepID=UPI001BA6C69B|nr:dienelactone hydrolase family protein [Nocardioides palaemonis]MBS2939075.1 dienelactone hydrolase family protein [Nocardioides palaemonis]
MPTTTLTLPDGDAEAYVAPAPGGEPAPGVLLVIDAIGLRPRIEEMADRIASWGYTVLAPNVFFREGSAAETSPTRDLREPGAREEFMGEAMGRVQRLTTDLLSRDLPAYLAALRDLPEVAGDEVGVTGYCMGARIAIRASGLDPAVVAVGGWHGGGLVTDEPDSPHRALATARASYAFGHASDDRSMPPEAVEALGAALDEAGLPAVNEVFPGPHGYSMSDTSMYDEESAERHFASLRTLLDATLRPASA